MRPRPEVVLLVVASLFFSAAVVYRTRVAPPPGPGSDRVETDGDGAENEGLAVAAPDEPGVGWSAGDMVIGPPRHGDANAYVRERRDVLAALAGRSPDVETMALVSFARPLEPAQAEALAAGVRVHAARFRLPAAVAVHRRVPVDGQLLRALAPAIEAEALSAGDEAAALQQLAETTDDADFAETYTADAEDLRAAAADGSDPTTCACVYALEISGSLRALSALAADSLVALVDIAPPSTSDNVTFLAVVPSVPDS